MSRVVPASLAAPLLLTLLICVGCGDDDAARPDASMDGGMDSSIDATMDAQPIDGSDDDAGMTTLDRLQGLWEGPCRASDGEPDAGPIEWSREGFAFQNDAFVTRIERYFDAECASPIVRLELSGTVEAAAAGSAPRGGWNVDLTIEAMTIELVDPDYVTQANQTQFLGFDDWQAIAPRDVLGIDVFGTGAPLQRNDVVLQIARIDTLTAGSVRLPVVYFGRETSAGPVTDPNDRPTVYSGVPHAYAGPTQ